MSIHDVSSKPSCRGSRSSFSSQNPTRVDLGQSMRRARTSLLSSFGTRRSNSGLPEFGYFICPNLYFVQVFICPNLQLSKPATADLDGRARNPFDHMRGGEMDS